MRPHIWTAPWTNLFLMFLMETFFHEFGFRISILFKIDGRQKIDPVWISGTLNFALDLMSLFVTGKGPFLSQERLQLGKDSSILGKDPFPGKILSQNWWILSQFATGKGPFLSQLQTGKAWKGERKGFRTAPFLAFLSVGIKVPLQLGSYHKMIWNFNIAIAI